MQLKKLIWLLITIMAGSVAFAQKIVEDANVEERLLKGSFNKLHLQGNLFVYLSQDAVESVAVSADIANDRGSIQTYVQDGKLFVSGGKGKSRCRVYLSFKALESIEISGLTSVDVVGSIQQDELRMSVSGKGKFSGSVSLERIDVTASGLSAIDLAGKVGNASVTLSGVSHMYAKDLRARICTANVSGSSIIKINVSEKLTVVASGTSNIKYLGDPVIKKELFGLAAVEQDQ